MAKLQTIVLLSLTTCLSAKANAMEGSLLQNRDAYYGGFSLNIDLVTICPTDTYSCNGYNSSDTTMQTAPCCPLHTFCNTGGVFCCPTTADCSNTVLSSPTCADPSWTLYSNGGGAIICCPSGTYAAQGGFCDSTPPVSNSAVDLFTSEAQSNNAAPTGDATFSDGGGGAATTTTAANTATTAGATNTAPATGSPSVAPGSSAANSPTSSSTGSATTPSPTKSSAAKTFAAGGALVFTTILVHLLL